MVMIPEQDQQFLRDRFTDELENEVTIIALTRKVEGLDQPGLECEFCKETEQLVNEVAGLSDKINVRTHEYSPEDSLVRKLAIDKIPAVLIVSDDNTGVRFFGIPGGFEFSSLVEDVIDVSRGRTDLPLEIKNRIRDIDQEVHIQIFVTPTCPYCPAAVRMAHQMAIENPKITSDAIEASEFPHLVSQYDITAVPTIVINDKLQFEGSLPEDVFADQVTHALAA